MIETIMSNIIEGYVKSFINKTLFDEIINRKKWSSFLKALPKEDLH